MSGTFGEQPEHRARGRHSLPFSPLQGASKLDRLLTSLTSEEQARSEAPGREDGRAAASRQKENSNTSSKHQTKNQQSTMGFFGSKKLNAEDHERSITLARRLSRMNEADLLRE